MRQTSAGSEISYMSRFKNDFTDQMVILIAIMVPALIGSWIGGGAGFIVALVIAAPLTVIVARYVNRTLPSLRKRR
jgi:fatty-acid desaturase